MATKKATRMLLQPYRVEKLRNLSFVVPPFFFRRLEERGGCGDVV